MSTISGDHAKAAFLVIHSGDGAFQGRYHIKASMTGEGDERYRKSPSPFSRVVPEESLGNFPLVLRYFLCTYVATVSSVFVNGENSRFSVEHR